MGDVTGLGPRGESPAEEGQACSIVAGFGIVRWGDGPGAPLERWGVCQTRGCEEVQKAGKRGEKEEEEHVGGVLERWGRAGSGCCPAGVQGREQRGHRGGG